MKIVDVVSCDEGLIELKLEETLNRRKKDDVDISVNLQQKKDKHTDYKKPLVELFIDLTVRQ